MDEPTIPDRVRSALALRRVDVGAASVHLGLSKSAMSRRMTGEVDFSATELQKIAELAAVPVSSLYGEGAA